MAELTSLRWDCELGELVEETVVVDVMPPAPPPPTPAEAALAAIAADPALSVETRAAIDSALAPAPLEAVPVAPTR